MNMRALVIEALGDFGGETYGVPLRVAVSALAGRDVAIGALYVELEAMERDGLIVSREGEATPERGGRPKRYFRLVEVSGR